MGVGVIATVLLAALVAGAVLMVNSPVEGPQGVYKSRDVPISFSFRRGQVEVAGEFSTQSLPWRMMDIDSLKADRVQRAAFPAGRLFPDLRERPPGLS